MTATTSSISRRDFVAGTGALVVGFAAASQIVDNAARAQAPAAAPSVASPSLAKAPQLEELNLEAAELFLINRALARHNGNAQLAAKDLGLSRSAFYRRLQKFGISVP